MGSDDCPECYGNPVKCWRDQDMNPVIKDRVTYQRHANIYYHTLNDALAVWGNQIEGDENDNAEL